MTRQPLEGATVGTSAPACCGLTVWRDPPAAGPWNMAADEALARTAEQSGRVLVRLYGWQPDAVSLGGFQPFAESEQQPELTGWPIVRRPSGGGAIVHGSDLTYCLALPMQHPWSRRPEDLYTAVHGALVDELCHRGAAAAMVNADLAATVPADSFFCFNRRALGDVIITTAAVGAVAGGCKVLGSAQRRLAGVVLQHGSLLLRRHPSMGGAGSHAGLADLAAGVGDGSPELVGCWLCRLAERLGGPLKEEQGVSWAADDFDLPRRARWYAADDWLRRR
ncbi:MAG: Octanoyltransferase LipM [Planctomycetota bacterium]